VIKIRAITYISRFTQTLLISSPVLRDGTRRRDEQESRPCEIT
jgi:hypothetical protein